MKYAIDNTATVLNTAKSSSIIDNSPNDYMARLGYFKTQKTGHVVNGNGAQSDNLFLVAGAVELAIISEITAITDITTLSNVYYDFYDGASATSMTDSVTPLSMDAYGVGSWMAKIGVTTAAAITVNTTAGSVTEATAVTNLGLLYPCIVTAKGGESNYVRLGFTGDANTAVTMAHTVYWKPRNASGAVTAV